MTGLRAIALICALTAITGCNLLDLSSRINQAGCHDDGDCVQLNQGDDPGFQVCHPFVCSENNLCEPGELDADRDGFIPLRCATDPAHADCNDFDPSVHSDAPELCDEQDNDCDGHVDEGSLEFEQTTAVAFDEQREPASDLSWALDASSGRLGLAYALGAEPAKLASNVITYEDISLQEPFVFQYAGDAGDPVLGPAASIALLPARAVAAGAYLTAAPARLVVGAIEGGTRFAAGRIAEYGLNCLEAEACAANSGSDGPVVPTPASSLPAIAAGADATLVAYTRLPDGSSDACPVPSHMAWQMLGNLVLAGANGLSEATRFATKLGDTTQPRAPALVAVPGTATNGRAYGWLLAYPDNAGSIAVVQVTTADATIHVSDPLLHVESTHGALHTPSLVVGASTPGRATFGLVALQGCGPTTRAVMMKLEAKLGTQAGLALQTATKLVEIPSSGPARGAAIAFSGRRLSWAVSYRDAVGLRAQIIDDNGVLAGSEPYTLEADHGSQGADSTAVCPLTRERGWFAVFSYSKPDSSNPGQMLRTALHSCRRF